MATKPITIPSGIVFADETLANYDEGTWTPTITSETGSPGTVSASGAYTRIGRMVFCEISISITTKSTAGGDIIATLPINQATTGTTGLGVYTGGISCRAVVNNASSIAIRDLTNATIWADSRNVTVCYIYRV